MLTRITQDHTIAPPIPLNYSSHIEDLVFFHGLRWFGFIAPHLSGHNPVLTRQPLYRYPDIPKAFYLCIPMSDLQEGMVTGDRILNTIDSYMFEFNNRNKNTQANARGEPIRNSSDIGQKRVSSDGGTTWVHDPAQYSFLGRPRGYIHQRTDEELYSGSRIINEEWRIFETRLQRIINSYIPINQEIASSYFIHRRNMADPIDEPELPLLLPKSNFKSIEEAENILTLNRESNISEWIRDERIRNAIKGEVKVIDPIEYDTNMFLPLTKIMLFRDLPSLIANQIEKSGIEAVFKKDFLENYVYRYLNSSYSSPDFRPILEIIHLENYFDSDNLAYFFSGINGDRPYTQFLNLYHVLESEFRGTEELASLKTVLQNKSMFPDGKLEDIFRIASKRTNNENEIIWFKTKTGGWQRHDIAETIYYFRNPIAHSRKYHPKWGRQERIVPFTKDEFQAELEIWVIVVREMARTLIGNSPIQTIFDQ